jgi:poly [ADP-ribose] polymerase
MFLNEAALGKEHIITMDDYQLTSPPAGYDSVLAKGRTEPGNKNSQNYRPQH